MKRELLRQGEDKLFSDNLKYLVPIGNGLIQFYELER